MKIFSAAQFKEANRVTTEKQNVSLEELKERASTIVFNEMHNRLKGNPNPIKVICGIGNNGGDGLVIARHLIQHGYNVDVFIINCSDKRSKNFLINYDKIKNVTKKWPVLIKKGDEFPALSRQDFIVDALFGNGMNRPLDQWVNDIIDQVNASGAFVLALDMPSGLYTDKIPTESESVVKANFTLSYQAPKIIFFLPQVAKYAGEVEVIDIGLDREFLQNEKAVAHLIGKREALPMFIPRDKLSHKGSYGHAFVVGGSYGKIGSVALTSLATMRTGAGLCTSFVPKCGYNVLQTFIPEAMLLTDEDEKMITNVAHDLEPTVVCFGVGVGTDEKTYEAFKKLLQQTKTPTVIDADGLNLLAKHEDLLELLPKQSVLTPHPKELERLLGEWKDDFEKLEKAREFVKKYEVILVIKGAYTFTLAGDETYINNSGNAGMATAGSGDLLAGVITGLISQGYEPAIAALFGVYLHGKAGDLVATQRSQQGMIARDIAENIGAAFISLFQK